MYNLYIGLLSRRKPQLDVDCWQPLEKTSQSQPAINALQRTVNGSGVFTTQRITGQPFPDAQITRKPLSHYLGTTRRALKDRGPIAGAIQSALVSRSAVLRRIGPNECLGADGHRRTGRPSLSLTKSGERVMAARSSLPRTRGLSFKSLTFGPSFV